MTSENNELSELRKESEEVKDDMEFSALATTYYLAFLDDGHGLWDTPGKRTPYIQELGRSVRENEFNSAVVDRLYAKLKPLGIIPFLVAPGDTDRPLKERTNFANSTYKSYQNKYGASNVKAVYVSIHYDALGDVWANAEGNSIYVYKGQSNKNSGKLAESIASYLKQGTEQKWRGIKEENFHVVRETSMPAVLTENGFMSNKREAGLMLNEDFQEEVATEHAKGIAKYFNVTYKDTAAPKTPASTQKSPTVATTHKVVKGDTFTKLAADYNVSVDAIQNANPKVKPTEMQIGQTINIPASSSATKSSTAAKTTAKTSTNTSSKTINGIKVLGNIKIVNVSNAAYICDKPSSNSKNIATIALGKTLPIAGSVPGWYEVIYEGKRRYVNEKYGKRV